MKKVFLGLLVVTVLLLVSCGNGSTGGATAQKQPNYLQIPYEDQEEYLKTEYYTESVPYTDQECEERNVIYKKERGECKDRVSGFFGLGDQPARYSCTITNLDTEGGAFSMEIGFNVGSQKLTTTQNKYIYPQSSEIFTYETDAAIDSCFCAEDVPTKTVCHDVTKYREVQRERQVTAYRPVTKSREVCN